MRRRSRPGPPAGRPPAARIPRAEAAVRPLFVAVALLFAGSAAGQGAGPQGALGGSGLGSARPNPRAAAPVLTLRDALAAALEGSRDLLLAQDRLKLARTEIRRGWAAFKPRALLRGSLIRNDKEIVFAVPDPETGKVHERVAQDLWQAGAAFSISQPLFSGPALPTLWALEAQADATRLSNQELRAQVLHAVAQSFYAALALQETVEVAERHVADTGTHLEATRARFEAGEVSKVALLRAEIDRATAEQDLTASRAALASAKAALGVLIGRPRDAGPFHLRRPPAPELPPEATQAAAETALVRRPAIRAAERRMEAAEHLVTASWLAFLPSLDLSIDGRFSDVTGFLRDDKLTWAATLSLSIPLYDGGLRYAEIQRAHIQRHQAQLEREHLLDQIRLEVEQAQLNLRSAAANLEKAESTARLARENYELLQARFTAGLATSLDVTDSSAQKFAAETEVVRQQLELDLATLALARALGLFEEVARGRGLANSDRRRPHDAPPPAPSGASPDTSLKPGPEGEVTDRPASRSLQEGLHDAE